MTSEPGTAVTLTYTEQAASELEKNNFPKHRTRNINFACEPQHPASRASRAARRAAALLLAPQGPTRDRDLHGERGHHEEQDTTRVL